MNPYEILGVRPGANPEELLSAWRRAARATHPDHGGDDTRFAAALAAYTCLRHRRATDVCVVVRRRGALDRLRRRLHRKLGRDAPRVV